MPFVEACRVAPDYDSDLLFKDLKRDAGIGIRPMAYRAVVRQDWAISDEGNSVWAMICQLFSRSKS